MVNQVQTETVIVGAGPIGIEMAVALKKAGHSYLHIDAALIANMIYSYPPETRFFSSPERIAISGIPLSVAGQNKASREDYLHYLRNIVLMFDLQIETWTKLAAAERLPDGYLLTLLKVRSGETYQVSCRNLILATGDMHEVNRISVPGEDLPHVSHELHDVHKYFRSNVLIVGGRNSAVEAAIRLYRLGANVKISYRRDSFDESLIKYWLFPEINSLIESGEIEFFANTVVRQIRHESVTLEKTVAGAESETVDVPANEVLLLTGYKMKSGLYQNLQLKMDETGRPELNEQTQESSVPGIYVIGTAIAGNQARYTHFIENSHIHVDRVLAAITGLPVEGTAGAVKTGPVSRTSFEQRAKQQPES